MVITPAKEHVIDCSKRAPSEREGRAVADTNYHFERVSLEFRDTFALATSKK